MNQDFYRRICRALDHLLKQYMFGLLNRDVRDQLRRDLTHLLSRKSDVWYFDINTMVYPGNRVVVHIMFSDQNDNVYKYVRRLM